MRIQHTSKPREGSRVRISVVDARGPVQIRFYVGRKLIHSSQCPDPPCHEWIRIPSASAGQPLRIVAVSAAGGKAEKVSEIHHKAMAHR